MADRPTILFIDDDENDAFFFRRAAHSVDPTLNVVHANNGQTGIDYLKGEGDFSDRSVHPFPRVVVVDLKMPVCDGFGFLEWKQKQPHLRSLPVVVHSSSALDSDIMRSYQLGASSYTSKAADPEKVRTYVSDLRDWWFGHCKVPQTAVTG